MAQTTISDGFLQHPKVLAAGEEAIGLYLRVLIWCNAQLTDGVILRGALDGIARTPSLAARLVEAGLWEATPTGWAVHNFAAHNPSRAEVLQQRSAISAAKAAAGRLGGKRSGEVRAKRAEASAKQNRSTDEARSDQPRTVHAGERASEPSESESDQEIQKAPTTVASMSAPAREAPLPLVEQPTQPLPQAPTQQASPAPQERKAVVVAALPPDPEGARLLAALTAAAGDAIDTSTSSAAMRADLAARLGAHARVLDDDAVARMAALCATPKAVWPWATSLGTGPVTVAWLLGRKGDDGIRTGRPLLDLITKAHALVAADRRAQQARQREAEQIAAMRERQANAPPRPVFAKGHFIAMMAARRSASASSQMAHAS